MSIPDEALDNHLAILGKTGAGKTVTAKGAVERLLDAGERVCIIDPTGAWWGLRLMADGKTPGYPVAIFGGSRADCGGHPMIEHPHTRERAELLLDALGRNPLPVVPKAIEARCVTMSEDLMRVIERAKRPDTEGTK
ncbi:MAG: DUF87 domain-containing protein [Acidobacteria bacterium]|nr:DUF87 domain-containing protein [Acidobacteriota bacterium]